jgi:hypothetical protein
MLALRTVTPFEEPSNGHDLPSDRLIYHSDDWLRFVAETHGATPVRAELREDGETVGSPFPGWTTP